MSREIVIPHDQLSDGHTTTVATENAMRAHDLNLHLHDVLKMEDDFKKEKRILTVKNTKYFFMGGR